MPVVRRKSCALGVGLRRMGHGEEREGGTVIRGAATDDMWWGTWDGEESRMTRASYFNVSESQETRHLLRGHFCATSATSKYSNIVYIGS